MRIEKTGRTVRMELIVKPEIKAKILVIKKQMQDQRQYYYWGKYSNNDVIEKLVLDHETYEDIREKLNEIKSDEETEPAALNVVQTIVNILESHKND